MVEIFCSLNVDVVLMKDEIAHECLALPNDIESISFPEFPSSWSSLVAVPSLGPGRTVIGPDFTYYNPFTSRLVSEREMEAVLRKRDWEVQHTYNTALVF